MFVYFHVGEEISMPEMLTASIRHTNPGAPIIMCTDQDTPEVPGVTEVIRRACDVSRIMTSRISAFAELQLQNPAVYLDTDMLVSSRIDVAKALGTREVCLCRRRFMRDMEFNSNFRGLSFPEHAGKTMDQVFPILACFTISKNYKFWRELKEIMDNLPDRYSIWYGDQQAMKQWVSGQNKENIGLLDEGLVALLPDKAGENSAPVAYHFKGQRRKPMMEPYARRFGFRN